MTKIADFETDIRTRLVDVVTAVEDKEAFRKFLLAIEVNISELATRHKFFTTKMRVDLDKDYKVTLEGSKVKPRNWSVERLGVWLRQVYETNISAGIMVYSITVHYDSVPEFGLGEHPNSRKTCCDLKKPPRSKDYFEQIGAAHIATATSI